MRLEVRDDGVLAQHGEAFRVGDQFGGMSSPAVPFLRPLKPIR